MATDDKDDWEAAVEEKIKNMDKYDVWTPRKLQHFSTDAKVITSAWATKKTANVTYKSRINSREYKKVEVMNYDTSNIASPVTNNM